MTEKKINYLPVGIIILFLLLISGCGGDGSESVNPPVVVNPVPQGGVASLRIDIVWPDRKEITGQVIHPYMRQVDISVTWSGGSTTATIIDPNTSVIITDLPAGDVTADLTARNDVSSSNRIIAHAIIHQTLVPGLNTSTVELGVAIGSSGVVDPNTIPICAGDTLFWINNDTVPYTIVFTTDGTGTVDSGPIAPGGTFSHQFTNIGTYPYSVDGGAGGTVMVGASPGTVSTNYKFVTQWGGVDTPCGVAVDRSGNVYVSDTFNNCIKKFDFMGNYLTTFAPGFSYPRGVAVDSSGKVYVSDEGNDCIVRFDPNDFVNTFTSWGSWGSGPGQFRYPHGVALDTSGKVYVADESNNRIVRFDPAEVTPTFTSWGSEGSGPGQFRFPYGVASDSSGKIYVADTYNHRIVRFDPAEATPTFTSWGSAGSGQGQFLFPYGVALDTSGKVYVADSSNHRIVRFDPAESPPTFTSWGSSGTDPGQFNGTTGLAVDVAGNVYVADTVNNRIQVFAPQ